MQQFIDLFGEQHRLLAASFFGKTETFAEHKEPRLIDALVFITPFALLWAIASLGYQLFVHTGLQAALMMSGFILIVVFLAQILQYYMNKWKAFFIAWLWGSVTVLNEDGTTTVTPRLDKKAVSKFYISFGYIELLWSFMNLSFVVLLTAQAESIDSALSAMGIVLSVYGLVRFCQIVSDSATTKYARRIVAVFAGNILFSIIVLLVLIALIIAGLAIGSAITGQDMLSAAFWQQELSGL